MLNLDQSKLYDVAGKAYDAVLENVKSDRLAKRWINAIAKAVQQIEENGSYMTFDGDALIIWSQGSNEIYEANGKCSCKAFVEGQPCWHRAASRLVKLNHEQQETVAAPPSYRLPELWTKAPRVGAIRL